MTSDLRTDLRPITPRDAVDRFLQRRESDATEMTLQSYRSRANRFVRWCEHEDILNLNELNGRHLSEYLEHRQQTCNRTTLNNEFGTLKKLFEFCVAVEGVEPYLPDKVDLLKPSVSKKESSNDEKLDVDRAKAILEYLGRYERASRDHIVMTLLWHTGCRMAGLRGLDLDDFDSDECLLEWRHRPETGTPLKNKDESERDVSISPDIAQLVDEYIRHKRIDVDDEHGRRPLLTTERGRISKGSIRIATYRLTQPCLTNECPHDREIPTCEYRDHGHESKCPSSLSPHRIRTGSITWMRERGIPAAVVAERVDATPETIRYHYDRSDPRELMKERRSQFDKLQL